MIKSAGINFHLLRLIIWFFSGLRKSSSDFELLMSFRESLKLLRLLGSLKLLNLLGSLKLLSFLIRGLMEFHC